MAKVANLLVVVSVALLFAASSAMGQPPAEGEKRIVRQHQPVAANAGKSLAILVGVQDYDSLPRLEYCRADVQLLEKTLKDHCNFDKVISMTEAAPDRAYRPTLGNLSKQLRLWLQVANNGDYQRVLLYFSGHGFRDVQGRLYFAPPDCDRQNLELTGLPQAYVKQMLDGCTRVPVKLLLLDCCHAGEGKGNGVGSSGSELAGVFQSAKGLLTLASCRDEEVSLEWPAKRQGLFTYWLCAGLKGAADSDSDNLIGTDELHRYVFNRVQESAAKMGREQTVVMRPSDDWRGVAVLAGVDPNRGPVEPSLPDYGSVISNSIGMKLVCIPDGEFIMGSRESAKKVAEAFDEQEEFFENEHPVHPVTITRRFYMGLTEVTYGQFRDFVAATRFQTEAEEDGLGGNDFNPTNLDQPRSLGATWKTAGSEATEEHPVVLVSWNDAVAFCEWLSRKEGATYRLPTEAEWEYACRAGTTTRYWTGDDPQTLVTAANGPDASFRSSFGSGPYPDPIGYATLSGRDGYVGASPVAKFRANPFGLHDMHGNVWEWCHDGYDKYYYLLMKRNDPTGPSRGDARVIRGGCFM